MAVEVREIVIKATITQDSNAGGKPQAGGTPGNANHELIKLCVEKVLEIIKSKNGR